MENVNIEAEERKAGRIAAAALKASLINQIKNTFNRRTGALEKSTVLARYKSARLDRLVLNSPRYSFQTHFGSSLPGTQKATARKATSVKSFQRHLEGKVSQVQAHERKGGRVSAMRKNEPYRATNHIAKALNQSNALENLATALGNNRMVLITSQINF
ncbi:hypothetical protein [Flavobacterium kayseriense]|nr:hypothetical protein [Flavobacterium kayseriense]